MGHWTEIEHTADLSLHVWGRDLVDLFTTAARGMFSLVASPGEGEQQPVRTLALSAPDVETLLVDWLNELLYVHETAGVVVSDVTFEALAPTGLRAEVWGVPVGERLAYIKAVTFHNLEVVAGPEGYETELVFDV